MKHLVQGVRFKDLVLIPMLLLIIVINTMDFLKDISQGDDWEHVALEVITVSLSILGLYFILSLIIQRKEELQNFVLKMKMAEDEVASSRKKLQEIGREYREYIDKQFQDWALTPSEKDVGLLILKGLSFKEIADIRNTKEKTVRQQATMIYRKSNVSSRHEFSAWFFEDMLG